MTRKKMVGLFSILNLLNFLNLIFSESFVTLDNNDSNNNINNYFVFLANLTCSSVIYCTSIWILYCSSAYKWPVFDEKWILIQILAVEYIIVPICIPFIII